MCIECGEARLNRKRLWRMRAHTGSHPAPHNNQPWTPISGTTLLGANTEQRSLARISCNLHADSTWGKKIYRKLAIYLYMEKLKKNRLQLFTHINDIRLLAGEIRNIYRHWNNSRQYIDAFRHVYLRWNGKLNRAHYPAYLRWNGKLNRAPYPNIPQPNIIAKEKLLTVQRARTRLANDAGRACWKGGKSRITRTMQDKRTTKTNIRCGEQTFSKPCTDMYRINNRITAAGMSGHSMHL